MLTHVLANSHNRSNHNSFIWKNPEDLSFNRKKLHVDFLEPFGIKDLRLYDMVHIKKMVHESLFNSALMLQRSGFI